MIILNKKIKILLAEKSKNLVSALMLLISHIKNTEVKEIGSILNVGKVDNLNKELKKEKPDVLIINGGFVDHKTRETVPILQELYPAMTILILSTDPGLEKKYLEIGIENFIIKGDSAEDFYDSMVNFLKKEQKRFPKVKYHKYIYSNAQ
ncbi:MAG: response regulator transcription factor [Actinobacteria bacterium]|nr:response regulator transcription factor [Actinomycetota bacterium]MBE3093724.1 response regulator transcription factor [Actinomycetota bacterium]